MTIARVIALAAAVLVLAGCAPAATVPVAEPTATSTPTPTPTPTPVADGIVFDTQAFTVVAGDGSALQTFTYFDAVDDVVPALAALFGADPTVADVPPREGYPQTSYTWDGFVLYDSQQEAEDPYYVNFRFSASVASLNGVRLMTVDGVAVGDDPAPIEAANPELISHGTPPNLGYEIFTIGVDIVTLPDYTDDSGTYPASLYLSVFGPVGGAVETISGPLGGGPGI